MLRHGGGLFAFSSAEGLKDQKAVKFCAYPAKKVVFGGVSYTEERAESMLFSDLPMGEEKYYLYADLVNTDITASDLTTLNGKRIGLLEGSVQATQFYAWEEEQGVQLEDVYAFAEDVQKSREAGMDEHLSKPVDMDVLEQTLRKFRVTPPRR